MCVLRDNHARKVVPARGCARPGGGSLPTPGPGWETTASVFSPVCVVSLWRPEQTQTRS